MLQDIRDNATGWISKTIIGVIIVLFALTGFEAIFQSASTSNLAAKVNGEEISRNELQQAMDRQRRQMAQQYGDQIDIANIDDKIIRQAALDTLIAQRLLAQAATNAGFAVSQEIVNAQIIATPDFQIDGKYNQDLYIQLVSQAGYTPAQYQKLLAAELVNSQLQAAISGTTFITDAQIKTLLRLNEQTRDFAFAIVPQVKTATVTEVEVADYYQANTSDFMSPEQAVVEYVQLNKSQFANTVKVTDKQLQDQYAKEIANLAEQRRAAHILIEVNDDVDDVTAKAKALDLEKRIAAGEDFTALAKANSDDLGSSLEGGDLGYAGPGVYDAVFEKALFALKEGEVSKPVRGDYGWHIIKLIDINTPEVPSFESLKVKMTAEVSAQQIEQKFIEQSKLLAEKAYESSGDLQQLAQELELTVEVSEPVSRQGLVEGIFANKKVQQAVFSEEVLENGMNSDLIELDPETVLVLRVKQHIQSKQLELAEVAENIKQKLIFEKGTEQAKEQGAKLITQLKEGQTADLSWTEKPAAGRGESSVDPRVVQALFRMPKPVEDKASYHGLSLANGDFAIIRLSKVNEIDTELSAEELSMARKILGSRAAETAFTTYREQLRADAKIEIFNEDDA